MIKKELLSPVGNKESLLAAIHNGCDAVYLGGKKFGARAFADNFQEEEMLWAIKYCHLYGVKIYVTVNTMIYESELKECLQYIRFLHKNNVDAVILQDIGLMKRVRETFPNLEIHASTQMHTHNKEQLKLLEELGIKRVVLARELSIDEIKDLDTPLEIEAFVHGALCISYSGQCLFSSLLLGRSGNRGACAGICRLPFKLNKNGKEDIKTEGDYLLSPKEFSTLEHFKEIMESTIYSLKIEGRMKSPAYVAYVTRLYRKLMDAYLERTALEISKKEMENLKVIFNRGFTKGHLFFDQNNKLMNIETSNHQGIHLGTVLETNTKKIKMKLDFDLHQEDGIRFSSENKGVMVNFLYNEKGLLIHKASSGDIVFVDNKIGLKKKGEVLKTIDSCLEKELKNLEMKKIPISCKVVALLEQPFKMIFSDGENEIYQEGSIVTKAINKETTEEVIKEKIGALGNSPFVLKNIDIQKEEAIFLPLSELKEMRRKLVEELISIRENMVPNVFVENQKAEPKIEKQKFTERVCIHVSVRTEEQLEYCLTKNVDSIYVLDENLYEKYKENEKVFLRLSRVKNNFKEYKNERLLVGETGALYKYGKWNSVVTDYYFNIANCASVSVLESLGANRVTLSIENDLKQIEDLVKSFEDKKKIEIFLYGRPEVMVMKHCPLRMLVNKDRVCTICSKKDKYYLKDRNNKLYPIVNEVKNHLTHIFYYKNIDGIKNLNEFKKMGIEHLRIEFFEETPQEIESILCKIL